MQCNTYVPDGFEFKTVGGSTFQCGFILKVSSLCVTRVWMEVVAVLSECRILDHHAVVCSL